MHFQLLPNVTAVVQRVRQSPASAEADSDTVSVIMSLLKSICIFKVNIFEEEFAQAAYMKVYIVDILIFFLSIPFSIFWKPLLSFSLMKELADKHI